MPSRCDYIPRHAGRENYPCLEVATLFYRGKSGRWARCHAHWIDRVTSQGIEQIDEAMYLNSLVLDQVIHGTPPLVPTVWTRLRKPEF